MLIGGPNQSHKVNFKELLPMRERCPRHGLSFAPSILFLKNLSEKIGGDYSRFRGRFFRPARVASGGYGKKGFGKCPLPNGTQVLSQKFCACRFLLLPINCLQNTRQPKIARILSSGGGGFFVSSKQIQAGRPAPPRLWRPGPASKTSGGPRRLAPPAGALHSLDRPPAQPTSLMI
jgi:hypothetical protein